MLRTPAPHRPSSNLVPGSLVRPLTLYWEGPLQWLTDSDAGAEASILTAAISRRCGIYLWTIPHEERYIVYAAGQTGRPFANRFREHTTAFLAGTYNLLDLKAATRGERALLWQGLWFRKASLARLPALLARGGVHFAEVEATLRAFRIFVIPLDGDGRLRERLEAAIMQALYLETNPFAAVPDRGMALRPRRRDEEPLCVTLQSPVELIGLPGRMEV